VTELIPLFPLGHVLLPGMPLPLHVFEERYRQLLQDLAEAPAGPRFGVVALRSGIEVESVRAAPADRAGPDVETIGTLAEILEIEPRGDGTFDVLSVGSRRFAIEGLRPEGKPYLRAEIRFLDEVDGELSSEHTARARELLEFYDRLLLRLAGRATGAELPADAGQLSYQIAARLPLPPAERQTLLSCATTAERFDRLTVMLRREIGLLRRTRSIAVSPAVVRVAAGPN
jgi:Lon protease-like protein